MSSYYIDPRRPSPVLREGYDFTVTRHGTIRYRTFKAERYAYETGEAQLLDEMAMYRHSHRPPPRPEPVNNKYMELRNDCNN